MTQHGRNQVWSWKKGSSGNVDRGITLNQSSRMLVLSQGRVLVKDGGGYLPGGGSMELVSRKAGGRTFKCGQITCVSRNGGVLDGFLACSLVFLLDRGAL